MRFLLALLLSATCATAFAPGDVNHDGTVTTTDSDLVLQFVVGALDSAALDLALADISGDGVVTAYDAALILQVAEGAPVSVSSNTISIRLADVKRIFQQ